MTGDTLDHALVLFFQAERSELGEDGLEFHLHGGRAVVAAVLGALERCPEVRQALPGEFARRAFANGKMDLAQIEGLADLIEAETEWQRRQAQRQLSGALRDVTAPWRQALLEASAQVETAIDFAEDVELGDTLHPSVLALIDPIRTGLRHELAQGRAAEWIRDGVQIVIAGPPNAGKSTLLNVLARRDAAIVSPIAGTTRDVIEVHLDLGGCAVTLVDTAGLRESVDTVERIGISRARDRAESADLVLWLNENGEAPPVFSAPIWSIASKADLNNGPIGKTPSISAMTHAGIDALVARLEAFVGSFAGGGASGLLARARHRQAFDDALTALDHLAEPPALPVEFIGEDLRRARFALARLIGTVDVEDILGDIFSRFCIGK
jgi:tRNA modification GTPase